MRLRTRQGSNTGRIESLSDNIFAVAMTILVLSIRIPQPHEVPRPDELWPAIVGLAHHLRAFAVSFLIVGSIWTFTIRSSSGCSELIVLSCG
jgi:uncharacterized membrane protein